MKVVTYNIHKGEDINKKNTLDDMIKYFKNLDWDVLCLQEVLQHQFLKFKKELCVDGIFAMNVDKPYMKYGICTLSKMDIESYKHIFLTSLKEQRGLLNIHLKNEVNIINTHLGLDKEERVNQINEILQYTKKLSDKVIICGDINEKNINIKGYEDSSIRFEDYATATFYKTSAKIDYIFVKSNMDIESYYVDKIYYSDHYPVICKINTKCNNMVTC